ncbi:hypothetical protein VP01_2769g2 [Puccinia sorghi]|uniref:Uncharacterized protein n=1 Tax=Puccinia sorghi TaxID=27349 RepID=A0A0L6V2V1_9BASI|nr:hypothetical protein VP01_2769g2 [Puccinia sorghi]
MFNPRSPSCKRKRRIKNCSSNGKGPTWKSGMEHDNDIQAQSNFYLTQGFFHKLRNTAAQIWVVNYKPCGINHWMSMPNTVHLLVETYNRPVFYFSSYLSQSFFHYSTGPNNNQPIFLARHFVELNMEDEIL